MTDRVPAIEVLLLPKATDIVSVYIETRRGAHTSASVGVTVEGERRSAGVSA